MKIKLIKEGGRMTKRKVQWHPAFAAALRIELEKELEDLIIEEEHLLSHKPLQIDILLIKKTSKQQLDKNIARIFKEHNIIEYKSPNDSLSINDFYKVLGYACIYQADTKNGKRHLLYLRRDVSDAIDYYKKSVKKDKLLVAKFKE